MPSGNKVKVQKIESSGQYRMTIPRAIAEALNLNGALVEVSIASRDSFTVKVIRRL